MRRISIRVCELCVVLFRWDVRVRDIHLCSSEHHFTIKNVLLTPTLKSKRQHFASEIKNLCNPCKWCKQCTTLCHCDTVTVYAHRRYIDYTYICRYILFTLQLSPFTTAILKQWLWHWRFHARFLTRCSAIAERPRCRVCYSFRQK